MALIINFYSFSAAVINSMWQLIACNGLPNGEVAATNRLVPAKRGHEALPPGLRQFKAAF
jgi:hypothetical protein